MELDKEYLKGELTKFRKERNKPLMECLQVLLSDVDASESRLDKNLSGDEILNIIKKQHKSLCEMISFKEDSEIEMIQMEYLDSHIPAILDEYMTECVIDDILNDNIIEDDSIKNSFGMIMGMLPKNVDKKIASKILRTKMI